jgi:hypothetical protein
METCTAETGLLRKKPCGHAAVTHCLNCERLLCSQHAVAQLNEAGHKSGKFLCPECKAAWRDIEKTKPIPPAKKPADKPTEKAAPAAAKPAAPAAKPAAPAAAAKPAVEKPAEKHTDSGMIEFTPSKPPQK